MINPDDFVITRRRKKYKFAHFANFPNCYEAEEWRQQPLPAKPLVVELGAGTALFSLELARRHPDNFHVAVDVKADRLYTAARQAMDEGLENIAFVRAHAAEFEALFPPRSIAELWLTFSDPFPKKRHAKHRLTHPRFLTQYQHALAGTGTLRLKTDNHPLFDWSLEQLVQQNWHLHELSFDLHESNLPGDYRIMTTFEHRFVSEDLPVYFVAATR